MTRFAVMALVALGLAGCGADGEPETPSRNATPVLAAATF